jgi:glutamine synthetase
MESDQLVRRVLGAQAADSFLELKRKEWRTFSNNVSTWEHAMYFHI